VTTLVAFAFAFIASMKAIKFDFDSIKISFAFIETFMKYINYDNVIFYGDNSIKKQLITMIKIFSLL